MEQLNKRRILVKVLTELSIEMGFDINFLSEDWITVIKYNNKNHYIYGYEWELNSATSQLIAKDKTATFDILNKNNIKSIEHKLFFNYNLQAKYTDNNGCWCEIMNYVQKHRTTDNYKIICKPNKGTGGNDVYKISNQIELESTVQKMFAKYRDLCLCPFYKIENEFRAIFLNGDILLLYLKEQPYVVGNGTDNLVTLILNKYHERGLSYIENLKNDLGVVLSKNERKTISWKHNLGNGAKAIIVEDTNIKKEISDFVKQVADVLNINFASIDIVVVEGEYYVMEVNSGIMIENFATQTCDSKYNYYEITKGIYKKAIESILK